MMINNSDDVYKALKQRLGSEPRQDIWEELLEDDYVSMAVQDNSISEALNRYKVLQKRRLPQRKPKPREEIQMEPPDERLKYLSEVLAWDAGKLSWVVDFRNIELNGKLLQPDEIKGWIERTAKNDQDNNSYGVSYLLTVLTAHTPKLSLNSQGEMIPDSLFPVGGENKIVSIENKILSYVIPGDTFQYALPVTRGGTLEKLYEIRKSLSSRYSWQEAETTTFILTGITPLLSLAISQWQWNLVYPALSTITLTVNPRLSPKGVADIYTRNRNNFIGKQKRNRPMERKHLELALFYHAHEGMKGTEMKKLWNEQHPEYKPYEQIANFDRDARHAYLRLIGKED
jgi:hypothetical protein